MIGEHTNKEVLRSITLPENGECTGSKYKRSNRCRLHENFTSSVKTRGGAVLYDILDCRGVPRAVQRGTAGRFSDLRECGSTTAAWNAAQCRRVFEHQSFSIRARFELFVCTIQRTW